jgi:hypothetical protein
MGAMATQGGDSAGRDRSPDWAAAKSGLERDDFSLNHDPRTSFFD